MVNLYVRMLQKGLRTLDSVPETIREKVRELLETDGLEIPEPTTSGRAQG